MNDAVNRDRFHTILGGVFIGFMLLHLVLPGRGGSNPSLSVEFLLYLWGPVTTGITAVGIFYFVFEKWLWRLHFLRPWLVNFPDLTGTWYAEFEGVTFNTYFRSIVKIDHRFTGITFTSFRRVSDTDSLSCMLTRPRENRVRLYVIYENTVIVSTAADGTKAAHGAPHNGCFRLDLANEDRPENEWVLRGNYWTDKRRKQSDADDLGTWGRVSMRWQHRHLAAENDPASSGFLDGEEPERTRRQLANAEMEGSVEY